MGIRANRVLLPALWIAGALVACQPPPAECECNCDEAVAKAVAEVQVAKATTPPPAPGPAAAPATRRATGATVGPRASGPVSIRPGAGPVVKRTPEERTAMQKTFSDFLKAAEQRKLPPITAFLTARLGGVLERNAERYEPRFFRGLEETLSVAASGLEIGETRDAGQGNVEALFRFGSGHERRVVFFLEQGAWKLNRL